jgi:peptidoglycan/LPS O-acetylase OafA/YrhL
MLGITLSVHTSLCAVGYACSPERAQTPLEYFVYNVLLYTAALAGFACLVARPPQFLSWFTFLGEESYALYAVHFALVAFFGIPGIFYAIALAFAIEFASRPKEIMKRLRITYSNLLFGYSKPQTKAPVGLPSYT